jgi:hypothetical protein
VRRTHSTVSPAVAQHHGLTFNETGTARDLDPSDSAGQSCVKSSAHPFDACDMFSGKQEDLPMSQRAVDFVHMWISANVHLNDFIDERHDARPKEYAAECRKHASAVGISAVEIKESYSDLEHVMTEAIEKESRSINRATGR